MLDVIKGTLSYFGLAAILAFAAFLLLGEYRRLFKTDPKAALSVEVLKRIILSSGVSGYLASFLLAASVLCLSVGVFTLLLNIAPFLNMLD